MNCLNFGVEAWTPSHRNNFIMHSIRFNGFFFVERCRWGGSFLNWIIDERETLNGGNWKLLSSYKYLNNFLRLGLWSLKTFLWHFFSFFFHEDILILKMNKKTLSYSTKSKHIVFFLNGILLDGNFIDDVVGVNLT